MTPSEPAISPPASGRGKALLFRLAALAMVPGLLVLVEVGLRLADWPAPTEPVMPQEWGADTRIVTPGTRRDYLERREGESEATRVGTASALRRDGFMQAEEWDLPKPEGRYRVFCFGGSATLGVPVEREPERTFPGQLEGLLTREGLDAEVINLGGASFGTHQVVELMGLVAGHEPDALVVYSGNNEFFNYALELASHNPDPAAVLAPSSPLRLVRLLHLVGGSSADRVPAEREAAQRALVGAAVRSSLLGQGASAMPKAPERVDRPYRDVVGRFEVNVAAMVTLAGEASVPLFLVEVPANLLEPPLLPAGDPFLGLVASWRFAGALRRGGGHLDEGRLDAAEQALDAAIELDPRHAQARYLRGLARLRGDRVSDALEDLRAALWLDLAPGRPLPVQGDILATVAGASGVRFVSTATHFETAQLASGDRGHFHDVCHLTPEGQALLARLVARALLADRPPPVAYGEAGP